MQNRDKKTSQKKTVSQKEQKESRSKRVVFGRTAFLMVLCGVSLIISDRYSLKTNSRSVMLFNALVMFVVVGMFFLPSSTATTFAILAVPVAMLVPRVFVRMGTGFTETLYRLMLLAAVANMVAMCWM